MMASRKSEAATQRPKKAPSKSGGMMQLVLVGVGVVVVIIVAMLLFGGGGKKTGAARTKTAGADSGSTYGGVRKAPVSAAHRAKANRDSLIAKRREERLQRKTEVQAGGSRTTRSSSGGYSSGGSSRAAGTPNQLRAILTDNSGSRTALVGERRLKAGDDLEGRRIVEVSGEGVKVEYRQNTYTVRVGEKIY
jgi:hypothetical protein